MSDKCPEYLDNLYAYIDGELSDGQRIELKAHLEECPPCLTEYERDLLLKKLVQRACGGEEAPQALRESIMMRITSYSVTTRVQSD